MRSGVNGPASSSTRSGTAGPWTSTCATFRRMRWHGWRPLPSHRARGADAVPDVRRHGAPGLRVVPRRDNVRRAGRGRRAHRRAPPHSRRLRRIRGRLRHRLPVRAHRRGQQLGVRRGAGQLGWIGVDRDGDAARLARRDLPRPGRGDVAADRGGGADVRDVRELILDATERLLAARRFESLSVADVLDAAGVSRGSFYFYFANKHAVLGELVRRAVGSARDAAGAWADDASGAPGAALRRGTGEGSRLWREHARVLASVLCWMNERAWYLAAIGHPAFTDEARLTDALTEVWQAAIYSTPAG